MAVAREYATTLTVTLDQLRKMRTAQQTVYDNGGFENNSPNVSVMVSTLTGLGATILGLLFIEITAVGVATGVASLVSGLFAVDKSAAVLQGMVLRGVWGLDKAISFLEESPRYDMLEIKFPFIEYTFQNGDVIRFVTGNGVPTKAHVKGSGWEILS